MTVREPYSLSDLNSLLQQCGFEEARGFRRLTGGDINEVFQLTGQFGSVVMKLKRETGFSDLFSKEAKGLEVLKSSSEILQVPKVLSLHPHGKALILEHLETIPGGPNFWENFGRGLAKLHRHSSPSFGWDQDNYIGSLPQINTPTEDWADFYANTRIRPLARQADKLLGPDLLKSLDKLSQRFSNLFPPEAPALLHGDLWSGNFIPRGSTAALIDPAVYFGSREMDLAMSRLFGGFSPSFFNTYQEEFPLEPGWEQRVELCQLYPLLVHVNLFGSGYVSQVADIVRTYE